MIRMSIENATATVERNAGDRARLKLVALHASQRIRERTELFSVDNMIGIGNVDLVISRHH